MRKLMTWTRLENGFPFSLSLSTTRRGFQVHNVGLGTGRSRGCRTLEHDPMILFLKLRVLKHARCCN